ncbi:MAG: polysaccharide deacetylase family protein, partial [Solirubrobacteraceae bacterium]
RYARGPKMPATRTHPPLVLAYHGLGKFDRAMDPHNLMVDPERFRSQIAGLRDRGYRFVGLDEFVIELEAKEAPPPRTCALTFDDGTTDNADVLVAELERLGVPATVFVCPGLLGRPHFAMPAASGVRLMDAPQVRQLAAHPLVDVGSHTMCHVEMSRFSLQEALIEMEASRDAVEQLIDRPVTAFAYPKCSYSPDAPEAARRAGYRVAVTCGARGGWSPFELRRESVDSLDRRMTFALKSRGVFHPLRDSGPGRAMRKLIRPLRHHQGS